MKINIMNNLIKSNSKFSIALTIKLIILIKIYFLKIEMK